MKIESRLVHAGDRRKAGPFVPVTTPIYTAASYFYETTEELDRVFAREISGPSYARYDNPTTLALEELVRDLEGGAIARACASGMSAIDLALRAVLLDRPKRVLAATMLYGATTKLLNTLLEPMGVETCYVEMCDTGAVERALAEHKPGLLLLETISNPLLRVAPLDRICALAKAAGVPVVVDSTFATPLLVRPLELGASVVVHSATKYFSGHGDVLGGIIVSNAEHSEPIIMMARTIGPVMSPFESYLTMRGIKTLGLRFERQCSNAVAVAQWLRGQRNVERVYFPDCPRHPDRETIDRLFPAGKYGAMISFELKDAGREQVFATMDRLKMVVRATSLGDVHTMVLYPAIASHRDLAPKQRQRLGIGDNLIRLSIGIEAVEDITADLAQALAG